MSLSKKQRDRYLAPGEPLTIELDCENPKQLRGTIVVPTERFDWLKQFTWRRIVVEKLGFKRMDAVAEIDGQTTLLSTVTRFEVFNCPFAAEAGRMSLAAKEISSYEVDLADYNSRSSFDQGLWRMTRPEKPASLRRD